MSFWEFLITAISGGAFAVLARELSAAYIKIIKGKQEVSTTQLQEEIAESKRQEERTERYIDQLRKDYVALKQEFEEFKDEVYQKETANNSERTRLERANRQLEVKITKAEAYIERHEEKMREANIKFKPYGDSGTKEHPPTKDQ